MKIAIIHNEFGISGAPMAAFNLARYLKTKGYEITAIGPNYGPLINEYAKAEINCQVAPRLFLDARTSFDLAKDHDMAIVFCVSSYWATFGFKNAGKLVIVSLHEAAQGGTELARLDPYIQKSWALADAVTVNNDYCKLEYQPLVKNKELKRIYIGVEPKEVLLDKPVINKSPDHVYGIMLGSVEGRKGQDLAGQAMQYVPKNVELQVYGRVLDSNYYNVLQNISKQVSNFRLGQELNTDMAKLVMADSDFLVIASRDETIPNVLIEAQLQGKTVIATNVGGISEAIKNGETGFLVPKGDIKELGKVIAKVGTDKSLRDSVGKAGKEQAMRTRTLEAYGSSFVKLIEDTFKSKSRLF